VHTLNLTGCKIIYIIKNKILKKKINVEKIFMCIFLNFGSVIIHKWKVIKGSESLFSFVKKNEKINTLINIYSNNEYKNIK
jgi:hypothetical protein